MLLHCKKVGIPIKVAVGVVEVERMIDGKRKLCQYEIDFVINVGNEKVYIQSALNVDTVEKRSKRHFLCIIRKTSFTRW